MRRRYTATVVHLAYTESAEVDRYGNPQPGYAEGVSRPVYAVSPKQSVEPDEMGRRAVLSGRTVYADWAPGPHDRVIIDGTTWEVSGEPGVWADNPNAVLSRNEGVQFDVERSTG